MGTNRTTLGIRNVLGSELDRIAKRRDVVADDMRDLHDALVEARVGVLALRGIGVDENQTSQEAGLIHNQQKLDGEVRELIAELAGLFVLPDPEGHDTKPELAVASVRCITLDGDKVDAEGLLDFAAQAIAQRLHRGDLRSTLSGPLAGWLSLLESKIRGYYEDQEKSL